MKRNAIARPLAALAVWCCLAGTDARADADPDPPVFVPLTSVQLDRDYTAQATITGIDESVPVTLQSCSTQCAFSLDGGVTWLSGVEQGTAQNADVLHLRMRSSTNYAEQGTMQVAIGTGFGSWSLTTVGAPQQLTVVSAPTTTSVNTAFPAPIVTRVLDNANQPVAGIAVQFGPGPAGGASATFGGNPTAIDTTDDDGYAEATPVANGTSGTYGMPLSANGGSLNNQVTLTNTQVQLSISNSLNFEWVDVGQTATRNFTIQNSGNGTATVTGFNLDAPFSVAPGTCASIAPGASCTVTVVFTPTQFRSYAGTVTIDSNSANDEGIVQLMGTGTRPFSEAADPLPGATLLFPYFEVDLDDAQGANTFVSWRGAGASATLTHVTVWSDLGVPVVSFNVYLTGFDVASLDLRALLVDGQVPRSATVGQDPGDTISPKGDYSQDINYASCNGHLPYVEPTLTEAFRTDLQASLTGRASASRGNRCVGFEHGDNVARGYITIDAVTFCTQDTPNLFGYAASALSAQNQLAGEWLLTDPAEGTAVLSPAAALQAPFVWNSGPVYAPGDQTFYGTYNAFSAQDGREPLPTTWAADLQARDAEVIVWRDTRRASAADFSCAAPLPPDGVFPLQSEAVIGFDNEEDAVDGDVEAFPLATQRVAVGGQPVPLPGRAGWVHLGLSHQPPGAPMGADPTAAQAHVTVLHRYEHGVATGAPAAPRDSANAASHVHPN